VCMCGRGRPLSQQPLIVHANCEVEVRCGQMFQTSLSVNAGGDPATLRAGYPLNVVAMVLLIPRDNSVCPPRLPVYRTLARYRVSVCRDQAELLIYFFQASGCGVDRSVSMSFTSGDDFGGSGGRVQ